jgi:hypothetical protein
VSLASPPWLFVALGIAVAVLLFWRAADRRRRAALERFASLQHEGNDYVIGHHNGECDRFDNHHGGRRRKPADKSGNSEQVGVRGKRQRHHDAAQPFQADDQKRTKRTISACDTSCPRH